MKSRHPAWRRRLHDQLQRLDRELREHLVRVSRNAATGRVPEAGLRQDAERFRSYLDFFALEAYRLGPEIGETLGGKAHMLGNLVSNLERAAAGRATAALLPETVGGDPGEVFRVALTACNDDAYGLQSALSFDASTNGSPCPNIAQKGGARRGAIREHRRTG